MKDFVKKIALLVILILLPFFVYGEDRPEENSILRLSSVNFEGKTVYAVAMDDGSVKALTSDDAGYKLENSLWLVKHEPGNYIFQEFFTFQNIGTGKYLSFAIRSGVNGSVLLYLTTSNQSINLQSGSYGYYYENLVNPDDYVGDMLYIRYDPYYNEWRFYETLDDNKTESQNKAEESGMAWDDNTHPESNEKSSMEIPGSEVGEMLGSGNLSFGDILANLDKITDKIEYNDALESTASSIVVGSDATYPKSSYWKQSTIKVTVNSSTWTPVSFPMDVTCVTSISDVYVQTYNTEKRANGTKAWDNKLLTSSEVLKRGVAYNLATDETSEIILEFEVVATEGVTIKNEVVSVVDDYSHNLEETTVNGLNRDKNWYYIGNALFVDAKMNNAIDYACQYNGSSYVSVDLEGESFAPFSTFFVQYAGDYTMSSAKATRNSAPMLAKEKQVTEKYSLRIDGENSYYKTGIYFADGASTEGYVIGEDFLSFATKKGKGVEIYTVEDDADYSFNKRPIENTVVRLGLYVGTAGRYTISLDNISGNAESMILYDTYEQDFARLHLGETYTFDSERGSFDDRFAVTVTYAAPDVTTDNLSLSATNIVVVGNEIRGLVEGTDFFIYDTTGRLVYSAVAESDVVTLPFLNSGIYIVRHSNGWVKFIVK